MTQVLSAAGVGIDLHPATNFRTNVPQIRVSSGDERARALGIAFGCAHEVGQPLWTVSSPSAMS